ncbi:MAG: YbhB/YbcL family Raf kinase inhibitor-like protein [Acidobacteria bacterium]|nr:YbhB/YbcL family Raf kinase inhibitor-like protein [Acidobacteriota bacterium]MDW7983103.1 YbhB/YbcL family Raf kinase inhibitor-like protein [Acidobacteriota bacterium]
MHLSSRSFQDQQAIPTRFTCDGTDTSPHLAWSEAPAGTQSFVLIMDDPDAPVGTFTHWVVYDIPAHQTELPEGFPKQADVGGVKQGVNDFRRVGYGGPCPPKGHGRHRYFFKLYALDVPTLGLPGGARRTEVEARMRGHVLAEAQCMGTYERR